jgi:hypothetical protein
MKRLIIGFCGSWECFRRRMAKEKTMVDAAKFLLNEYERQRI